MGGGSMSIGIRQEVLQLSLREPFRIARSDHGGGHVVTTVIVEVREDRFPDVVGGGGGYPDRFYGETPEPMSAVLPLLAASVGEVVLSHAGLVAAAAAMDLAI